jgi:hypothetical protein
MSNKRLKFSNLFENLNDQQGSFVDLTRDNESQRLTMFDRIPQELKPIFDRQAIDLYEEQVKAEINKLMSRLRDQEAQNIIFWARPPQPIYIGKILSVIFNDRIQEMLTVQMENGVVNLSYGWLEEQQKLGRPVKIPNHFFKEPIDYIKVVKPSLFSLQQAEKIEINGVLLYYKFMLQLLSGGLAHMVERSLRMR